LKHYFGGSILFTGPIGTIIKTEAFNKVGGFDMFGMPSDNHFSLKIAARFPVISMYRDLFWWRTHEDQAFSGETDDINIYNNLNWNLDVLTSPFCPLDEANRIKAIKNCKKIFARNLYRKSIKNPFYLLSLSKKFRLHNIKIHKIIKQIF
jgi:hypothetical protein